MTSSQPDLDAIEARANAATPGPWDEHPQYGPHFYAYLRGPYLRGVGTLNFGDGEDAEADREFVKHAREDVDQLVAEVRRLRADADAALLPAWEAVYEPGNVSDYLIGYANDEHAAKGAAEAWMRSQAEVTGRLEWQPWGTATDMPDGYDAWFELAECHDDGIDTGPGIVVRRRAAVEESHVVADDSDDPEHVDDCPGCEAFTLTGHRAAPAARSAAV